MIGVLKLLSVLAWVRKVHKRHSTKLQLGDIALRYGRGSWAVVTGASDGMGAEYCRQLASKGFNICLVSRTLSKLEAVEKEIKEKWDVQTKIVQVDFSCLPSMDFYRKV